MKTFACIKGKIGDWTFYTTSMIVTELVNYVKFADQIFPRNDLDQIMQRELTNRSAVITNYLLNSEQRFMGSLIIAAVGGEPNFVPVTFGTESVYSFADEKMGFLRFDGSEKYYALDGQHRLAAIIEALKQNPEKIEKDEVSVILIWHKDDEEGRKRARRLFTTVNRYAKKTTKVEDAIFDEDNPIDIFTRRLVREHPFFSQRTKVANLAKQDEFRLTQSEALNPKNEYDSNFLLALLTLRRCNEILLRTELKKENVRDQVLPDFEVLEKSYLELTSRWNELLKRVSPWNQIYLNPNQNLRALRRKDGGNPFVRPIAIIALIEAVTPLFDDGLDLNLITKVTDYFNDLTKFPLRGLLWKEGNGGMHDGQRRREATAVMLSYYFRDYPSIDEVQKSWESATGVILPQSLPDRHMVIT